MLTIKMHLPTLDNQESKYFWHISISFYSDSAKIGIIFDTNNFFAKKKLFLVIFRYLCTAYVQKKKRGRFRMILQFLKQSIDNFGDLSEDKNLKVDIHPICPFRLFHSLPIGIINFRVIQLLFLYQFFYIVNETFCWLKSLLQLININIIGTVVITLFTHGLELII